MSICMYVYIYIYIYIYFSAALFSVPNYVCGWHKQARTTATRTNLKTSTSDVCLWLTRSRNTRGLERPPEQWTQRSASSSTTSSTTTNNNYYYYYYYYYYYFYYFYYFYYYYYYQTAEQLGSVHSDPPRISPRISPPSSRDQERQMIYNLYILHYTQYLSTYNNYKCKNIFLSFYIITNSSMNICFYTIN